MVAAVEIIYKIGENKAREQANREAERERRVVAMLVSTDPKRPVNAGDVTLRAYDKFREAKAGKEKRTAEQEKEHARSNPQSRLLRKFQETVRNTAVIDEIMCLKTDEGEGLISENAVNVYRRWRRTATEFIKRLTTEFAMEFQQRN